MKIPKVVIKGKHEYIFEKKYPSHFLYRDKLTGTTTCFKEFDLVRIKQKVKPTITKWERDEDK